MEEKNYPGSFCTCTNLACPRHPSRHRGGCTPCVRKCLEAGEIPSCFFRLTGAKGKPEGYTFRDFARAVLEGEG